MIESDRDLILAFVVRESEDYTPAKDNQWIIKVIGNIEDKIPDNLAYLKLTSIGNTGITIRQLTLFGVGINKCHLIVDTDGDGTVHKTEEE